MLSVFIPVYNEIDCLQDSLAKVHAYLCERNVEHEVIVVDNGSTDGTTELGIELSTHLDWLKFSRIEQRGCGRAFRHGIRQAKYENIVTLDVDLSTDLVFIDYALDLLKYSDVVIGSKTMGHQRRTILRVLGSQTFILFSQVALDLTISDYSIGSKALKKSRFLDILDQLDPWTGYIVEICLFARLKGYKTVQIGVTCNDTRSSRFNLLHECYYRFSHLYRCWRLLKDKNSWINTL